jgi:molecular chaperone GrpE
LKILVIFDTLEMAYQHSQDKNIQVSIQQFLDVLKSEGVTKIETVGKKFDPNVMEAITTGEGKEGIVLQELRVGFMIHESLLRAAQVTVGKGKE